MVLYPERQRQSRLPRRSAVQATLVNNRISIVNSNGVSPAYLNADPTKWKLKKQTFNGRLAGNFNKEEVDGKLIDDGIEMVHKNPSKYIAIMYRPSDRNLPKAKQGYAIIHRAGTSQFFPMEDSTEGEYMLEMQYYQRLPPLKNNNLPPLLRDKFTDQMTFNGKKLHSKKNKPIMPGRGMGVLDQPNMKLIGEVDPSDVKQGIIADCWLLSGISTLAEYDGAIRRLFRKTKNFDRMPFADRPNMYTISLWDLKEWKEVDIVIDERLCSKIDAWNRVGESKLLGAKPSTDGELWVPYLEKAIAIHCGGWDTLSYGANCNHAWALLAGVKEQCIILRKGDENSNWGCYAPYDPKTKKWAKNDSNPQKQNTNVWWVPWPEPGVSRFDDFEDFNDWDESSDKQLFSRMCAWDDANFLMACSSKGLSDRNKTDGIIDSHAYGIVDCRDNVAGTGLDMIQLRNPWGTAGGELEKGLFVTDKGKGWKKYPKLKRELNHVENDEQIGVFWLTREEFFKYFDKVYLSARDMSEFMGYKPRPTQRPVEDDPESRKRKAESEKEKENTPTQSLSPKPSPKKPKPRGSVKIEKNIPQPPKKNGFSKMVPAKKQQPLPPTMEEPSSKKEIEVLESKLEKYAREASEKDAAIASLQKELGGANNRATSLQTNSSKMAEEKEALENRCNQQKRKIEQLENQNKGQKSNDRALSAMKAELDKANKAINNLEQNRKESERKLEEKEGKIGTLRDELRETMRALESKEKNAGMAHDKDRVKLNKVTKQLEEKQAELDSQANKFEMAKATDAENRKKMKEKENRINSLVNELQQAKNETRSLEQNNEKIQKRLKASDGKADSIAAQLREAKQTIKALEQKDRGDRDAEYARLRKQLDAKQAEVDQHKAKLQEEKDSAKDMRKKLQAKEDEARALRDELQKAKTGLRSFENDRAETERVAAKSKQVEEKMKETRMELGIQASKLQHANERIKELTEELRMEQMENQRRSSQQKRNLQSDASSNTDRVLKEKDEKIAFLHEKIEQMNKKQQASSRRFETESKQKDSQLRDLKARVEQLRKDNEELLNEQNRLSSEDRRKMKAMEAELEKQRRLAESSKNDMEAMKASLEDKKHLDHKGDSANKALVAKLRAELEETKQRLRDMRKDQEDKASSKRNGASSLSSELAKAKNHSNSLQRAVEMHTEELKKKEKMIGALKSELKEQKQGADSVSTYENRSHAANVEAELEETKRKLKTQESENKESAEIIETLQNQIDHKESSPRARGTSRSDSLGGEGGHFSPLDASKYENNKYDVEKYSKPRGGNGVNGGYGSEPERHPTAATEGGGFQSRLCAMDLGNDDSINDYLDGLAAKVRAAKSQLEATQRRVNDTVGRHLPSRQ